MSSYTISVNVGGWEGKIGELLQRMEHLDGLLDQLADDVIFPILDRHYDQSGLRERSGVLKKAITKRGAFGNVFSKSAGRLIVGVSYAQVPYARWVLEGTRPHQGAGGSQHPGSKPHPIYFLDASELGEIQAALMKLITEKR